MAPCLTNHMALVIVAWLTKTPHQQFYLCASDKKQTLTHPLNLRSPINAIPIISGKTDVIILTTVRGFFFAIVRVWEASTTARNLHWKFWDSRRKIQVLNLHPKYEAFLPLRKFSHTGPTSSDWKARDIDTNKSTNYKRYMLNRSLTVHRHDECKWGAPPDYKWYLLHIFLAILKACDSDLSYPTWSNTKCTSKKEMKWCIWHTMSSDIYYCSTSSFPHEAQWRVVSWHQFVSCVQRAIARTILSSLP